VVNTAEVNSDPAAGLIAGVIHMVNLVRQKIRPRYLMLLYSILFLTVSVASFGNSLRISKVYFVWSEIINLLANVGNFAYTLRYPIRKHTRYWIVVAYLLVVQVVSEHVLSIFYQDLDAPRLIFLWVVVTLFCLPMFWANFSIALRKSGEENVA
jgi:hypothetical protein